MKVQLLRKILIGRENLFGRKSRQKQEKSAECALNWHAGGGGDARRLEWERLSRAGSSASADTSHTRRARASDALGCHPPQLFVNNSVSLLTSERAAACLLSAGRVRLCDVDDIHCFPPRRLETRK